MAISTNSVQFQLDQIRGSFALEGVVLTEQAKSTVNDVLEGRVSANAAKQAVIERYKRRQ